MTCGMSYPYKVDYNDHFETPRRAYEDVLPLLDLISPSARGSLNTKESKKRKRSSTPSHRDDHTLYDPYYCAGRAKDLLNAIGFPNVQHAKRDFYADVRNGTVPKYDTLVTNPPYSEDHKERCIEYAVQSLRKEGKPFLLLMPNYVALKEYWRKLTQTANGKEADDIVYVIPASPYEYDHPEGTGHEVPPFASLWFCGVGRNAVEECKKAYQGGSSNSSGNGPRIACNINELQTMGAIKSGNRKNPRQRRKMRKLMAAAASAGAIDAIGGGVQQEAGSVDQEAKRPQKKKKRTQSNDNRTARSTGSQSPNPSAANIPNASGKKKKKSKHRDASGVRKKKRF